MNILNKKTPKYLHNISVSIALKQLLTISTTSICETFHTTRYIVLYIFFYLPLRNTPQDDSHTHHSMLTHRRGMVLHHNTGSCDPGTVWLADRGSGSRFCWRFRPPQKPTALLSCRFHWLGGVANHTFPVKHKS